MREVIAMEGDDDGQGKETTASFADVHFIDAKKAETVGLSGPLLERLLRRGALGVWREGLLTIWPTQGIKGSE